MARRGDAVIGFAECRPEAGRGGVLQSVERIPNGSGNGWAMTGPVRAAEDPRTDRRARALWWATLATAGFAVALGTVVVTEALVGDRLLHPGLAGALRAAWIGLYAGVGVYLAWRRPEWGLGVLMTTLAAMGAVASLDAFAGQVPYTISRIVTIAIVPVAALMLMTFPAGRIGKDRERRLVLIAVPLLAGIGAAYLMVAPTAPWSQAVSQCRDACSTSAVQVTDAPGAARALVVALAAVAIVSILAALVVLLREIRSASPVAKRTLKPVAWLTVVWGAPLSVGLVALAIDPGPERLSPYLISTGIIRAILPLALLAVLLAYAVRTRVIQDELMSQLARARDPAQVESLMSEALRDPSLRLAFRNGAGWMDVEGRPLPPNGDGERGWVEMSISGIGAGAVTFDPALSTQGERMQAIAAFGAVALERARADAELIAVRQRLVAVAEAERRRIERSLHDGAQQHLVGMMVRMAMAREVLAARPKTAQDILGELALDLQHALDELRELAHGLYPAVLVDHGLPEALRSAARHSPVPVEVEVGAVGRFEPLREAAVYFCCAEALQNALKHAGSDPQIRIGLWLDADRALRFEVADRGPGFVSGPLPTGSGLLGMRDRVEGVGGTLSIESERGRGTVVRGRIPAEDPSSGAPAQEPAAG
jgi:signal transduction histidine kinase